MSSEPETFKLGKSSLNLYRNAPLWDGKPCGAIGNFNIQDTDDGIALIEKVTAKIKGENFHALLGPMNGDTWHSYRAVVESDGSAPFSLEPVSGPHDVSVLEQTGFKAVSHYHSTRAALKAALAPQAITKAGIEITAWDGQNGEALVDIIFALSKDSFAKNSFFKPVNLDAFRDLYVPLLSAIDPRFMFIAKTKTEQICGFLFGFSEQSAPADSPTIILKTYASGVRGLGYALADRFHRTALDAGFKYVIHALMHEDNASLDRSHQHNAETFRRYALFARIM